MTAVRSVIKNLSIVYLIREYCFLMTCHNVHTFYTTNLDYTVLDCNDLTLVDISTSHISTVIIVKVREVRENSTSIPYNALF